MIQTDPFEKYTEPSFAETEKEVFATDCTLIEKLLDACELFVAPENRFFLGIRMPTVKSELREARYRIFSEEFHTDEAERGYAARAYTGTGDFSHTTAEWQSVISLGIYGLRQRIAAYGAQHPDGESKKNFYDRLCRVYDAALRFMKRCAAFAEKEGKCEMAKSLAALTERAPRSLYEAMQTSFVYYTLQQHFDLTPLRTMGRLDSLFYPYFLQEDRTAAEALVFDYIAAMDSLRVCANLPFALGGTDVTGKSLANELSYVILHAYRKSNASNVKLHLLCSDTTPKELISNALDAVREGNNSIVFLSDKKVIESLIKLGAEPADAVDYHVVGCYECGANGELTCSCNARVNIPKALEYALTGGVDMLNGETVGLSLPPPTDFEELLYAFDRQLVHLSACAMRCTDLWEERYERLHASPILSATYTSALEKGGDLYGARGAKYNNSSVNALGLATAVDSLCAIRTLVFEEKRLTLEEFTAILRANWAGEEVLHLRCKNKLPKFGTGDPEADALARHVVHTLDGAINRQPNKKGGKYRLGLFSIDWRWEFGEKTAASADGRRAGEPLSQNTSATFGADREGATAHLCSVASIDCSCTPNGAIADIDLHHSAVVGENGLNALFASLKTYFDLGGFGVHYNVLNTDVLLDAKAHPEKYPHLQVRLCGWNVRFTTLSDREKEEFIARSMRS